MPMNRMFHGKPTMRLIVTVAADTVAAVDDVLRGGHGWAHGNRSEFVRRAIEAELARRQNQQSDVFARNTRARISQGPGLVSARELTPWLERRLASMPMARVPCGARRRRDGQSCEALSLPGKRRCKWHGGMSTGPKTPEGKAKVTMNLRRCCEHLAREKRGKQASLGNL